MPEDAIRPDTPDMNDTNSTTALEQKKKPVKPERRPKQLPPYRVLLHNDDVNSFEHVISTILKLTSLQPQDALLKTVEAHESGVAELLVTHRERAELYAEQFCTFKLVVSIEPA